MSAISDYQALNAHYGAAQASTQKPQAAGYDVLPSASFWNVIKDNYAGNSTGWKFHVSVAPEQLDKAWAIASDYLMAEGVEMFKVVTPDTRDTFADSANLQAGKMLTAYATENGPDMAQVLSGLEQRLIENGISPGPAVHNDRPIEGSRYLSYRNDGFDADYVRAQGGNVDAYADYVTLGNSELEALREQGVQPQVLYNPSGKPDPYETLNLASKQQQQDATLQRLSETMGDAVLNASLTESGAYAVQVPADYSRQNLVDKGVDPQGISRRSNSEFIHTLIIEPSAIPSQLGTTPKLDKETTSALRDIRQSLADNNVVDGGSNAAHASTPPGRTNAPAHRR